MPFNLLIPCFLWVVFALLAFSDATLLEEAVVHEKRIPNALWKRHENLSIHPSQLIPFRFGLKQSNVHTLYDELMKVSDPESSLYGAHWTPDRVINHFSPSGDAIQQVSQWLQTRMSQVGSLGRPTMSKGRTWLNVQLTLDEAEKLLDTKYHTYVNQDNGGVHIACEEYKLPRHVSQYIDIVLPTVHFDVSPVMNKHQTLVVDHHHFSATRTRGKRLKPPVRDLFAAPAVNPVPGAARGIGNPQSGNIPQYSDHFNGAQVKQVKHSLTHCDSVTTLDCLRALYKMNNYTFQAVRKNSLAIVEYTPQSVIYKDLDLFFSNFSPAAKGSRPSLVSIDGGVVNQEDREFGLNGESNLDLQYSMPFVYPLNVSLYQVGDPVVGGSFNNFLDALDASYCSTPLDPFQDGVYPNPVGYAKRDCGTVKPARVISTSYGMNEADATPAYLQRQCNEYGKLGLMGTTFLFSSGDNGVGGNRGVCLNRDGSQSLEATLFNPSFPGTCPYVTSVGATQLPPGRTVHDPEVACYTRIHSGGGFSNLFKLPKYQSESVKKYYQHHAPLYTRNQYNNSRKTRGFPDLSANGANFVVAVDGRFGLVYGTSASSPVVASILTMINDARIAAGKKSIGFINPAIYSESFRHAFNDIINGTNPGCGTKGFSAVPGWDPVTGLGTPDFSKLLPIWTNL